MIKTTAGLLEYQIYLDFLQNEFEGNQETVMELQSSIRTLIQILKQKVSVPSPDSKKAA